MLPFMDRKWYNLEDLIYYANVPMNEVPREFGAVFAFLFVLSIALTAVLTNMAISWGKRWYNLSRG